MSLAALAAVSLSGTAFASVPNEQLDPALTYVKARAASLSGDHRRSAELLARLSQSDAADPTVVRRALEEAISAGDLALALKLSSRLPAASLPIDIKLLQAGAEIRSQRPNRATHLLAAKSDTADLGFLNPFIIAWSNAERGDATRALAALAAVPSDSIFSAARNEHAAYILLKLRRPAEAEKHVQAALSNAGGRESRLRLAFADGYLAAGDRARAQSVIGSPEVDSRIRARVASGRPTGLAVDSTAKGYSELLLRLAVDLNQVNNGALPIALSHVARYVAPDNDGADVLLAILLATNDRSDDALAILRSIPASSALAGQARDLEVRTLIDARRGDQAVAIARTAAAAPGADSGDLARLGNALESLDRHAEAAAAYGQAHALAASSPPSDRWPLLLLQASALENADRWPEAKAALNAALALAPDQPLILNFLGYTKLERGEDLDLAEAMIRKASAIAPDDASITDSLGWALYKRGRHEEAIELLQRAARGDPDQADIQEHLGDALYRAGRKFEARFAWTAALTTAEDDVAPRIRAKIDGGLTSETAAP